MCWRDWVGSHTFHLGLSIGVAPIDGQPDVAVVVSQADAAMYQAKSRGRNRVEVCEPQGSGAAPLCQSDGWATRLKDALTVDGLVVYYQPLIRLSDGRAESFEARTYLWSGAGDVIRREAFSADAEGLGLAPPRARRLVERVIDEMQSK